jgi:hypothetical protein
MSLKKCARCKLEKPISEFNVEHVFAHAIGGILTVRHICASCNTSFNQKVDEPFVKSNFVLKFRHEFNLSDGRSSIPSISKNPIEDNDGNKRLIVFEDGTFNAKLIPKFSYNILPNGRIQCNLQIDAGSAAQKDEIIKLYISRLSRELGIDLGSEYEIAAEDIHQHPPIKFTKDLENNILIRECVKIAFEIATLVQPMYIDHPDSEIIRRLLVDDEISDEIRKYFDDTYISKSEKYIRRMLLFNIQLHQHAIFIENIENEGVFATIKIFDYYYTLKLTGDSSIFPREEFLLVNDILEKKLFTSPSLSYQFIRFHLEFAEIDQQLQNRIRNQGLDFFELQNESCVFYRKDGSLRYENHAAIAEEMIRARTNVGEYMMQSGETILDISAKKLFIKAKTGELVPIISITVLPVMMAVPLPKLPD